MKSDDKLISIVIPCYNEASNVHGLYKTLTEAFAKLPYAYELLYVNDGSRDDTLGELEKLASADKSVRILTLTRNFGKELATTAGITYATGNAIVTIDGDGQHPAELIPEFVQKWEKGAKVVVGVRESNQKEGWTKRYGSKLFYRLLNRLTDAKVVPSATDFRLIDRSVQQEFVKLHEKNRITRGLIDWLGFPQEYITFHAHARSGGEATYSLQKLMSLALNSFVSLSLKPLYFSFYVGLLVLPLSILLALFSGIEMLVGDPMNLNITGTAYLVILALFLLGIVLVSQGITALYLSHIHTETQNRPLFIIDEGSSLLERTL